MLRQTGLLHDVTHFRMAGLPAGRIGLAILAMAVALGLRKLASCALRRVGNRHPGYGGHFAKRVSRPLGILILLLGLYGAVRLLPLSDDAVDVANKGLLVIAVFSCTWMLLAAVDAMSDRLTARTLRTESRLDDQMMPVLRNTVKFLVAAIGMVFLIQALGYPVSGIITGLGIGGLAVALAAQDTLASVFASITIFLDRPFMVGSFVEASGVQGTVEDIGLRSTRLRTAERTLVTIPNRKLVDMTIDNLSGRTLRRAVITFRLDPASGSGKVALLLEGLRGIALAHPRIEQGSFSAHALPAGVFGIDIEFFFYLTTGDYLEWLSLRSEVFLAALGLVEVHGLKLAPPPGRALQGQVTGQG